MGGGGGGAGAVPAGVNQEAVQAVADLDRVVPWKCEWKGCTSYAKNGATHRYISRHIQNHREDLAKQQGKEAARLARRAKKILAKGPSFQRKLNRLKDTKDKQRAAAKNINKGTVQEKGGRGHGKVKSRSK